MFELLRKFVLIMLLFVVALGSYLSGRNATDWRETLWVAIYPVDGDGRDATAAYLDRLDADTFTPIEDFVRREAERYGVGIERPVEVVLGPQLAEAPPAPPPADAGFLKIAAWSLRLRWWAGRHTADAPGPEPDIRLFLVYHDPAASTVLGHSVGLEKGRVGRVNVFADRAQAAANNFVIVHEMLHTLGASDKYAVPSLLPLYPGGYARPDQTPLYPQPAAEVMGGRIALSATRAVIPAGLHEATVGRLTAREIRWID